MFRNYLDKIERDEDVRKNLIELRKLLKIEPGSAAWQRDRQRCLSLMLKLLKHEDAKVRKNAALILGEMGCQDALDALFYAYECEEKLFVKSAYLTAMSQLDYRTYLNAFRERMEELMQMEMTPENQKHLNEELKLLRDMLLIVEKPVKHTFTDFADQSRDGAADHWCDAEKCERCGQGNERRCAYSGRTSGRTFRYPYSEGLYVPLLCQSVEGNRLSGCCSSHLQCRTDGLSEEAP